MFRVQGCRMEGFGVLRFRVFGVYIYVHIYIYIGLGSFSLNQSSSSLWDSFWQDEGITALARLSGLRVLGSVPGSSA